VGVAWPDEVLTAFLIANVAVLLVLALERRWSVTASWFTGDKTCGERHATPWFVERLDMDCDRLLRGIRKVVPVPQQTPRRLDSIGDYAVRVHAA
jgi:hypothetical protein